MRIHNVYTDANGESHFRDIEIDCAIVFFIRSKEVNQILGS